MDRARTRRLLLGVLVVELIVPVVGLVGFAPPRQYSWSMFVESSTTYRYVGTDRGGHRVDLDPADVGSPWKDIHYGPQTLQLLCARHPGTVSVDRFYDGELERSETC